ncbi:PIN domain-containing protein [Cupriavidus sp. CuC1]|uniref:PIN domain-containing protein n=1 Tax=Cupriavidus sp. CuC1 TaxID=3373131 RepID=UPI0037D21000
MPGPIILVDMENIQQLAPGALPGGARLIVFAGASQKSISLDLVIAGQALEPPAQWIRASGSGRNALDFHIAFELGRLAERGERGPVFVLSKDKGYDPLIVHIASGGMPCKRVESLSEIPSPAKPKNGVSVQASDGIDLGAAFAATVKVREILGRSPKTARPGKRATLVKHLKAMEHLKLKDKDISGVIDEMLATKLIVEDKGKLSYNF